MNYIEMIFRGIAQSTPSGARSCYDKIAKDLKIKSQYFVQVLLIR